MIGEDKLLRFSGVPLGEACTLVLRGATQQILDEAERSMHDALCVLAATVKETRTVYGGGNLIFFISRPNLKTGGKTFIFFICLTGCSEVLMATAVYNLAAKTPGKESMAMEAFARALLQLPVIIADNAGYDSAQLVSELRAAHSQSKNTMGLSKFYKNKISSLFSFYYQGIL